MLFMFDGVYQACSSMTHLLIAQYTNACFFIGKIVVYIGNYATILICCVYNILTS